LVDKIDRLPETEDRQMMHNLRKENNRPMNKNSNPMNEPVKYKRLKEIATELNNKLDELTIGHLSKQELEQLTEHSRELYERLVVLRFKAYDTEVKGKIPEMKHSGLEETHTKTGSQRPVDVNPAITFRVGEPEKQIPVKEVPKEKWDEKKPEIRKVETPITEVVTEVKKPEQVLPRHEPFAVKPETPSLPKIVPAPITRSINERIAQTTGGQESLAKKLEHTPIPDLKKAISLNQRFQFARELFKGNNQDYEVSVEKLNTTSRDEALRHLNSIKNKYAWKEEDPVVTDFIELVERRHT